MRCWRNGKAAEWIVQKASEMGVAEVRFFPAAHSPVSRGESAADHARRWERIAWESCKQCDRQFPPAIAWDESLAAAMGAMADPPEEGAWRWLLDPHQGETPAQAMGSAGGGEPTSVAVLIGPEGGFAPDETDAARRAGFTPVRMGELVFRAETAALAACAVVLFGR